MRRRSKQKRLRSTSSFLLLHVAPHNIVKHGISSGGLTQINGAAHARVCAEAMSRQPKVASLLRARKADRGLFVGGDDETTTHYSSNGGAGDRCRSVTH